MADNSNNKKLERRAFVVREVRAEGGDGKAKRLVGHAAVFDTPADLGWFTEKVARGAFAETIKVDDVRALFNHNPNFVLGRNVAGTLRMSEDDKGLAIEIDMPDTQVARDLLVSIERKDVSQMSFGFEVIEEMWERTKDGPDVRTLKKVRLWDVSPVTFPAYVETDVAQRSHGAWQERETPKAAPLAVHQRRQKLLENTL